MEIAYSYIRFSYKEQEKGSTIQRQIEARDAWLKVHPDVRFDDTLKADEAASAFRGKHRENPDRNALAAFLDQVERGRVPRGSYLIVESLDRLTREHVRPALTLVLNLIEKGIRIVQLKPVEVIYDEDVEPMQLMMALMELSRGNSESRMKSERVGAAWAEKRRRARAKEKQNPTARMGANAAALTRRMPAWLRWEDGRIVVDEGKAEVVRTIFRLSAEGYGRRAILSKLNEEGGPKPISGGSLWLMSYIGKLLESRAVLGEHQLYTYRGGKRQPDGPPISDHFPRIVSDTLWGRAKAAEESRRNRGGRPSKEGRVNIFQGLLKDAADGAGLTVVKKGEGKGRTIVPYRAVNRQSGKPYVSFPLEPFEKAIVSCLRKIRPEDVAPTEGSHSERAAALEGELAELDSEIVKLKARLEKKYSDAVAEVLERQESKRKDKAEEKANAEQKAAVPQSAAVGEAKSLLKHLDSAEDRVRLRSALRRIIVAIRCAFGFEGRDRIAYARVEFVGGYRQHYVITYRGAVGGAAPSRPSSLHVATLDSDNPEIVEHFSE
jgi:DNA invertase Pin-like site-specific DNA recombinase